MTNQEIFVSVRANIVQALTDAGIAGDNILLNKNLIPSDLSTGFKAGIVSIAIETGKDGTRTRYISTDLNFDIYLIVDSCRDVTDPDSALYELKELFRSSYQSLIRKDIQRIEYYDSYVKGTHPVRVAKLSTITEKN